MMLPARVFSFVWTLMALCAALTAAPAQERPRKAIGVRVREIPPEEALGETSENWLVAIGVNRFQDPTVAPLSFCVNDAKAIHGFFTSSGLVPESQAYLLQSDAADERYRPTRNNILSSILYVSRNATPESSILFHFSGHGFLDSKGRSYLMPEDGMINLLEDTAVAVERVNEFFADSEARRIILFVDACRNMPRQGSRSMEVTDSEAFLRQLSASEGQVTLASCGPGQVSYEMPEARQGVFTYYLLKGLMGEAPKTDAGIVTLAGLSQYVTEQVPAWSKRQQRSIQQPWLEGAMSKAIPLAVAGRSSAQKGMVVISDEDVEPLHIVATPRPTPARPAVLMQVEEEGDPGRFRGLVESVFVEELRAAGYEVQTRESAPHQYVLRLELQYSEQVTETYGVTFRSQRVSVQVNALRAGSSARVASSVRSYGLGEFSPLEPVRTKILDQANALTKELTP